MTEARYWQPIGSDGEIRCTLCPHRCTIAPGGSGRCGARANLDGRLHLLTWGQSSGFVIDPVEKKPLYHFLPGAPVLSFGGWGCNLACACCQNWQLSRGRAPAAKAPVAPEEIAYAAVRKGCRAVAVTYNEPLIALEYAVAVAQACHASQVRAVAVTAGFVAAEARAEFFAAFDAVNVDLKAFSDDFYRRHCGGRLQPVLETLRHIARASRTWLEITTLVIPGLNDGDAEIAALARWIATELSPEVPLHLSAFHPEHEMRDRPPTPPETLRRARAVARAEGLKFVYIGNLADAEGETTRCPACGAAAIVRDRYEIRSCALDPRGHCTACGARLPGVFDGWAGNWGRRFVPVEVPVRRCLC